MAESKVFKGKSLSQFSKLFIDKKEYINCIREMDLKERLFDWKPATDLEKRFKSYVIDNALVKVGGKSLRVTSYLLESSDNRVRAYLSYGGKQLTITKEGREDDTGFFLTATPVEGGIEVKVESKREHYKFRTWALNWFLIIVGLILGVLPGILIAIFVLFIEPRLLRKKINTCVWPALEATLAEETAIQG
jgi:hypothetical protein